MPILEDGAFILSAGAFYAIIWVFTSVAIITTALRVYTRAHIVRSFGLDDALMLFGQLISIIVSAFQHWHIDSIWRCYNVGLSSVVNFDDVNTCLVIGFRSGSLADNTYTMILPIIKCSILAFYRRITPNRNHRLYLYIFAGVMLVQATVILLVGIFGYDPATAWWNYLKLREVRYDFSSFQIINSSFHVLYDIIILALPVPLICKTKFSQRNRIGITLIYLLSFSSLAATTTRLVYVSQFQEGPDEIELMRRRLNYALWAIIELMTVIMSANLPAMAALIRRRGHLASKKSSQSNSARSRAGGRSPFASLRNKSRSWFHSLTSTISGQISTTSGKAQSSASINYLSADLEDEKRRKESYDFQAQSSNTKCVSNNYSHRDIPQLFCNDISANGKNDTYAIPTNDGSDVDKINNEQPDLLPTAKLEVSSQLFPENDNYLPPDFLENSSIRRTDEFVVERSEV